LFFKKKYYYLFLEILKKTQASSTMQKAFLPPSKATLQNMKDLRGLASILWIFIIVMLMGLKLEGGVGWVFNLARKNQ
jgi:hypothetical protein